MSRGRVAVLGGALLALVVAVAVLVALVVMPDRGGPDTSAPSPRSPADSLSDPTSVTRSFVDATAALDCDAIERLSTPAFFAASFHGDCAGQTSALRSAAAGTDVGGLQNTVQDATVDGDTATVPVQSTVEVDGEARPIEIRYRLTRTDGVWRVSGVRAADVTTTGS